LLLRRLHLERLAACYAIGDAVVRGNRDYVMTGRDQVLRLDELLAAAAAELAQIKSGPELHPQARREQDPQDEAFPSEMPTLPDVFRTEPEAASR
jgi:hypothetical protein